LGAQDATGSIRGRVVDAAVQQPLAGVSVRVMGTTLGALTGNDGSYQIRGITPGAVQVRAQRIGYAPGTQPATVTAGAATTVDFTLAAAAVKLEEVVTTATGTQARKELGNAITTVNVTDRAAQAPVTDMASLLAAQAPGVQVLPGNTTGTGAQIRIRGVNSLTLNNDPIYIIDGVRMTSGNGSQSSSIFTGGAIQSRAQDIDYADIASIEVVKGPSAATLYGTDAANGVVVITTKRGRAGPTRFNVTAESGIIKDYNAYPTAYTLWGKRAASTPTTVNCTNPSLTQVSSGACVADSLSHYNVFEDPQATPLGTGYRKKAGLQISGGTESFQYFTSADYENESGVLKIPRFDLHRLDTLGVDIKDEWRTPNELTRGNFRANISATLTPKLDAQFNSNFITLRNRLPQSDNNALGLLSNAFGGPGYATGRTSTLGYDLHGYRQSTPAESFQDVSTQYVNRFIGSTTLNYHPLSWLQAHGDAGVDYADRIDQQFCQRGTCADVGTTRLGFVIDDRAALRTITTNANATATFQPREWLGSRTTVGVQWVNNSLDRNGAQSYNLTPGGSTLRAGATQVVNDTSVASKTLGLFAEEQVTVRDRLYLTAALRTDQNSAFGTNFQRVFYPKASVSYVISDEDWFPKPGFLSNLRLRAAYGASGVQPGPNDALLYYTPTTANIAATDQPGVFYTSLGNQDLRPERATEIETGFDTRLFGDRLELEATYYSKLTKDALVGAVIPPSMGTGNTSQRTNLGSVRNAGFELGVNSHLTDRPVFAWDLGLSASSNANKLVTLGKDAQGHPLPPQVGTTTRNQPGSPLFGYWQRKITSYGDKNGDGIITVDEITVADSSTFVGYSTPRYEATLHNTFQFLNKQLRITTLFDYKGGHKLLNGTQRIRCQSRNNCYEAYDQSAPLDLQARAVAVREHPSRTQAGYMEDASFLRFRELGVGYTLPPVLLSKTSFARSATVSFSARNLHKWTKYTGLDPESNADAGNVFNTPSDFQTVPPPTYFIFRLDLGF
jgi:TonB-linked SusC/RagA family outer membrane protein